MTDFHYFQMYHQNAQPKSDIAILLEILQKVVNESIERATPFIDACASKVESTAGGVEDDAENTAKFSRDKFREQLEVYKEMAKDAEVNINECLMEKEETLMNMPQEYYVGLLSNISDKVSEGISYAIDALKNVSSSHGSIITTCLPII